MAPLITAALGYLDDRRGGISPTARLAVQASVGLLAASSGVPSSVIPAAVIAVPAIVNVVNFMDGINGITSLTAIIWGINTVQLAERDLALAALGSATAGAALGFLPWNAPHAHLFLGDVGSYLFGGLAATGIISASRPMTMFQRKNPWANAYKTAAPLLPYAADSAQALIGRAIGGERLTEAHREHIYQRLVDNHSFSHMQSATTHAVMALGVAAAARLRWELAAPLTGLIVGSYLAMPKIIERVSRQRPVTTREEK